MDEFCQLDVGDAPVLLQFREYLQINPVELHWHPRIFDTLFSNYAGFVCDRNLMAIGARVLPLLQFLSLNKPVWMTEHGVAITSWSARGLPSKGPTTIACHPLYEQHEIPLYWAVTGYRSAAGPL